MAVTINGDTGIDKVVDNTITTDDIQDGAITAAKIASGAIPNSYAGTKNLIINGNMQIAQRGTSASGIASGNNFVLDRFIFNTGSIGTWTLSQNTDAPDGFSNSMKLQCTTANASPTGTNWCNFQQRIEAQNLQHLAYGTSSAKTITLSFWVKSNKTGTYTAMIYGFDSSPARTISAEYTISAADTWEKKTITFAGDSSGQIDNDNGAGFNIYWALGTGPDRQSSPLQTSWGDYDSTAFVSSSQVNLADSTSNYINITGVQLEVGDTATDFENLQYGQQLAMCQRYFEPLINDSLNYNGGQIVGSSFNTTRNFVIIYMKEIKRAAPTITASGVGGNILQNNVAKTVTGINNLYPNLYSVGLDFTASGTQGAAFHYDPSATTVITADAEL